MSWRYTGNANKHFFSGRIKTNDEDDNDNDDDNNNNNNNNETVLWNQEIYTDRVTANRPDIIINTKKGKDACC
jgi:hypothetical protein